MLLHQMSATAAGVRGSRLLYRWADLREISPMFLKHVWISIRRAGVRRLDRARDGAEGEWKRPRVPPVVREERDAPSWCDLAEEGLPEQNGRAIRRDAEGSAGETIRKSTLTCGHGRASRSPYASASASVWWTAGTTIDPSPTADATRLMEPARTSPAAKMPGLLLSSG